MYKLKKIIVIIVLSLISVAMYAQNRVIGHVSDVIGEPIIGASILEKGTSNGTITDIEGNFSLSAPVGSVLQVSYIGYITQELTVSGQSMKVIMEEDTKTLEEIVVVGFGTQRKVNLTGSVGIATGKDIEARPVMNVSQALQGMVPGLNISLNTGELDKEMNINIRGRGTIGDGSSGNPLVLIDGTEGNINSINPQDIDNISVLKDAAASSIYGSRAPFGVILITTKKGVAGKAKLNYNNSIRVSSPINMPEMMDSYTFANYFNAAATNLGRGKIFTDEIMQKMLDFQAAGGTNRGGLPTDGEIWGKPAGDPFTTAYANTDWFGEIYRDNNFSQEHNMSLSGGSDKITYYASLGFLNQSGSLRHGDDGLKRYNLSARINAEINSWIDFRYNMRFARTDNWRPRVFGGGLYERIGRQTWPNLPVYDENGFYFNGNADVPAMGLALGGQRDAQTDRLTHQGAFVFEPIKNWITNVEFSYSTIETDTRTVTLPYYNHDVAGNIVNTNGTSNLFQEESEDNFYTLNIYSDYSFSLRDAHNFKVLAGFQAEEMNHSEFEARAYGLLLEELPELDLTNSLDGAGKQRIPEVGGNRDSWATAGFFGRVNYNYKGKYLAEVNMRYDGTSRFRSDSRWATYPSVSLGWNIAHEEFWKPLEHVVNTLKLRGSYGELGNQNTTSRYPTYRVMELGAANGTWLQGGVRPNTARIGSLISTALTWETVRSWNTAIDWGLLNNRLTGSFDIFTRYTDNMVGPAPELPNLLGISAPKTNNCDLRTQGWELELAWNDRLKNGLGYGVKLMISDARTIIDSYPSNVTKTLASGSFNAGREIGEIWGYETIGIAKTQEEMDAHLEKVGGHSFGSEWGAGDIMYADLDGVPGVSPGANTLDDHGDLKVIGNSTPRYHFAMDLNASYKGFDLRVFFQGIMKREIWNSTNMFFGTIGDQWWSLGLKEHGDYFRAEPTGLNKEIPANLDSYYPRPLFNTKNQRAQTRYLQDASYIRLKNVQLGYTLPSSFINKISLEKCRIFVSGENLWTGTSLSKLFDPETVDGGNTDSDANSNIRNSGNAYPLSRTWAFGINITI